MLFKIQSTEKRNLYHKKRPFMNKHFSSVLILNFLILLTPARAAEKVSIDVGSFEFNFNNPTRYDTSISHETFADGSLKITFHCQEIPPHPAQTIAMTTNCDLKPRTLWLNGDAIASMDNPQTKFEDAFKELEGLTVAVALNSNESNSVIALKKADRSTTQNLINFINYLQSAGKDDCTHVVKALYYAQHCHYDLFRSFHEMYAAVKTDFLRAHQEHTTTAPFPFESFPEPIIK